MILRVAPPMASSSFPVLDRQAVHVWFCELSGYAGCQASFAEQLSEDERARAARFAFDRDRRRFILSHGLLRLVLSRYLHIGPGEIRFIAGSHGKPALLGPPDALGGIRFSLSHSGDYAMMAVARGREIGVDVEVRKPDLDCLKLAERFFAPAESQAIATLQGIAQQRRFYDFWTAKEAYLKGRGVGLSLGLDRFEILFDARSSGARVRLTESGALEQGWHIQTLSLPDHLAGAVAVAGDDWTVLRCDPAACGLS